MNTTVVAAGEPKLVGFLYKGTGIDPRTGQPSLYVGSTAQQLIKRISPSQHDQAEFLRASTTKIEVKAIVARPNVAASGSGTLRGATQEALRSPEQVTLDDAALAASETDVTVLNLVRAAAKDNVATWAARHQVAVVEPTQATAPKYVVKVEGEWLLRGPWLGKTLGVFNFLSLFTMYRDMKMSQYVTAPYLLQDEGGIFTISATRLGLPFVATYWKKYNAGPLSGQEVEITSDQFDFWKAEAYALWGYADWAGDFQPGIWRTTLPEIDPGIEA
jgi:hypothetical protein